MALFGDLERRVLDALWSSGRPLTVRDVHAVLSDDSDLAYTTVLTVLDRLAKKGLALRRLDGRAWLYSPSAPLSSLAAQAVTDLLADPSLDTASVLSTVIESLPDQDRADLLSRFPR